MEESGLITRTDRNVQLVTQMVREEVTSRMERNMRLAGQIHLNVVVDSGGHFHRMGRGFGTPIRFAVNFSQLRSSDPRNSFTVVQGLENLRHAARNQLHKPFGRTELGGLDQALSRLNSAKEVRYGLWRSAPADEGRRLHQIVTGYLDVCNSEVITFMVVVDERGRVRTVKPTDQPSKRVVPLLQPKEVLALVRVNVKAYRAGDSRLAMEYLMGPKETYLAFVEAERVGRLNEVVRGRDADSIPAVKLKNSTLRRDAKPITPANAGRRSGLVYGRSISTYGTGHGLPIADSFQVVDTGNGVLLSVADGCGWGWRSKQAAEVAIKSHTEFVGFHTRSRAVDLDTRQVGQIVLEALENADKSIQKLSFNGTTTFSGGLLKELAEDAIFGYTHAFVFAHIGDCKVYRVTPEGIVSDLTKGTRPDGLNVRDPGGRLGAEDEDFAKRRVIYAPVKRGDTLVLMSDGVHDNLDPLALHHNAPNYGFQDWSALEGQDSAVIDGIKEQVMADVLKDAGASSAGRIVDALITHCQRATAIAQSHVNDLDFPSKSFLYPGKQDHTTAVAYTVS